MMKIIQRSLFVLGALAITDSPVFAHSGEHAMSLMEGVQHFLAHPNHFWGVVVLVVAVIGYKLYRI